MNLKPFKNLLFLGILLTCSCASYKNVPYFQDLQANITKEQIRNYRPLIIQPGDILAIHASSKSPQADAIFNSNAEYKLDDPTNSADNLETIQKNTATGYLVDSAGYINVPYIGSTKVAGLTTRDVILLLQPKLSDYLKDPIINVRIQNFKISVFGDVQKPGIYDVQNETITLTEALSLAGDLNITGIRNNILLIREHNGAREFVHIDLTSKNLFSSPYYYLKNNDQIYVQPNRAKVRSQDNSGLEKAGLAISVLTLVYYVLRYH